MDYFKLAEKRESIREFKTTSITKEQLQEIDACFQSCKRLVPGIETELVTVSDSEKECLGENAGYQGLNFNAPCYLLLLSEVKKNYIENAGYINENLILKIADMGLNSCWLTVGASDEIKESLKLATEKQVTAIIALGCGKKERSVTRLHIKTPSNVKVTTREAHLAPKISISEMIYGESWNGAADLSEDYLDQGLRNAFLAASLAPSFLNRQPYRFIIDSGMVVLVKMMDTMTGEMDARLNCGAVMFNFAVTLSEFRPKGTQWILGSPDKDYAIPADCEIVGYCQV